MKRILAAVFSLILLVGCAGKGNAVEPGLRLREKMRNSKGCAFEAIVTADYGDMTYTFHMECQSDTVGNLTFCVKEPSSIQGITGTVSKDGGNLTFDDQVLAFQTVADGQITPVTAPWLFIQTLRGGYLRACENKKNGVHLIIDDSYAEDALQLDAYLSSEDIPERGDFLWRGKRILSIDVINFTYL